MGFNKNGRDLRRSRPFFLCYIVLFLYVSLTA